MMKTMKYYLKNILLAASCLWAFTACNDFLTLYPEDDIVDDEYWETGEDVQSVVASCYRFMLEDNVISRIIYLGGGAFGQYGLFDIGFYGRTVSERCQSAVL